MTSFESGGNQIGAPGGRRVDWLDDGVSVPGRSGAHAAVLMAGHGFMLALFLFLLAVFGFWATSFHCRRLHRGEQTRCVFGVRSESGPNGVGGCGFSVALVLIYVESYTAFCRSLFVWKSLHCRSLSFCSLRPVVFALAERHSRSLPSCEDRVVR